MSPPPPSGASPSPHAPPAHVAPAARGSACDETAAVRVAVTGATGSPLLDTTRARTVLGWNPVHSAADTLLEFLEGIAGGKGGPTAPLAPLAAVRPSFRP